GKRGGVGGMGARLAIERASAETPHLKRGASDFYPSGVGHQRWIGSTGNGRNPVINGRRRPSLGGTSRMMREYHVRICERLGVKFPGPTRHSRRFIRVRTTSGFPPKLTVKADVAARTGHRTASLQRTPISHSHTRPPTPC